MFFGVVRLLAMTKILGGVCPIVAGENCIDSQLVFYVYNFVMLLQHISLHTSLVLQLRVVVK